LAVHEEAPLRAWLTLSHAAGVGPRTFSRLLEYFGEPIAVLAARSEALAAAGAGATAIAGIRAARCHTIADAVLAWAQRAGAHVLIRSDWRYPPLLAQLPDAPAVLYIQGDPGLLSDPQLAVVGSRNPTVTGRETTRELARHLASCGLTITSGLAIGVDAAAHEGALEGGRTIAVMGTGPDRIYPAAHRSLARRIAERGALVSEFPPGYGPRGANFPRRNRIISGLSMGTLVTEAAPRSGSLITARYANEQGREVFAIPGSIHNPLARGCHALIRQGAKLVETAQDVLEELAPMLSACLEPDPRRAPSDEPTSESRLDADYRLLLDAMGHDPVSPDELIRRTGLQAKGVASMLLLLELEGYVSSNAGGRYSRLPRPAGDG
jgi:DNA processing protein